MTTTTITVSGMTCGHCEAAVKEELGALAGVSDVAVDLNAGAIPRSRSPRRLHSTMRRSVPPSMRPATR